MSKQSLRKTANLYLLIDNKGSPREKQYRRFVIHRMIEDLYILGKVPLNWSDLTLAHLQQLVEHWHKKKVKSSTIMNYMTIIRKFLIYVGNNAKNFDNLSLGLQRKKTRKKSVKISLNLFEKTTNPMAKILLGFQVYFGLTLSETMRILPGVHVQANHLLLTREITFNNMDRKIPIRSEIQMKLIQEFNALTQGKNLISSHGYRATCFCWQKAMKTLKLPIKKCWRYFYAQQLYAQFSSQIPHYQLSLLIMIEMGLKSRTTLWSYLNE